MTDVQRRSAPTAPTTATQARVTIRPYRPIDHSACRSLWAELIEHRERLYGRRPAEPDTGAGFEEYLTRLNLSGLWVADRDPDDRTQPGETVIGFVGVMVDGTVGKVDPIVVTATMRGRGIGRALLAVVVEEARRRGLDLLTVSPPTRDESALRALHVAGFATLSSVTVSYDLHGRADTDQSTLDLFDLSFGV